MIKLFFAQNKWKAKKLIDNHVNMKPVLRADTSEIVVEFTLDYPYPAISNENLEITAWLKRTGNGLPETTRVGYIFIKKSETTATYTFDISGDDPVNSEYELSISNIGPNSDSKYRYIKAEPVRVLRVNNLAVNFLDQTVWWTADEAVKSDLRLTMALEFVYADGSIQSRLVRGTMNAGDTASSIQSYVPPTISGDESPVPRITNPNVTPTHDNYYEYKFTGAISPNV